MAPRKRKAVDGGEEEAVKADTRPTTTRVTRSSTREANSNSAELPKKETGKVKAKSEGKKKKGADALKVEKEAEAKSEEEEAHESKEAVDGSKKTVVIEHCKQCNAFKTRAIQVKNGLEDAIPGISVEINPDKALEFLSRKKCLVAVKNGLEDAIPGISVEINPDKPRRGCLEIREEGGETFISLLDMKRPFQPMKALDMEKVISDMVDKIKGSTD